VAWLSYSCLIPPNLFILGAMIGAVLAWRTRRAGLVAATASIACLYVVSTPVVGHLLIRSAEALVAAAPTAAPGAVIVLSADWRRSDAPGEPGAVGPLTIERLAKAASIKRSLGLPILVSGGSPGEGEPPLAGLMSKMLQDGFCVSVRWREEQSRNTFENASFSAAILRRAGIPSALVVAHPWDMARVLWSFRAVGYPVVPMPTQKERAPPLTVAAFLPQIPALRDSYYALHELIGLAWYQWRYGHFGGVSP
jgi:uncharacterized SAM-binding protein YcdF (DUF218 family)